MSIDGGRISRGEFQGYVERHEDDHFAHAPMRHDLRSELVGEGVALDRRLVWVENWVQRLIGMGILLGVLIGGGSITLVIELIRK